MGSREGGYARGWDGGWIGSLASVDSSWLYKNMKSIDYEGRSLIR